MGRSVLRRAPPVLAPLGACLWLLACADAEPRCAVFFRDSVWEFVLSADRGERIEGQIRIVDSARRLVGTHRRLDGGLAALDEKIVNLRLHGDSLAFMFSHDGYAVRGQCLDANRAALVYSAPAVDAGRAISGRGMMQRTRPE